MKPTVHPRPQHLPTLAAALTALLLAGCSKPDTKETGDAAAPVRVEKAVNGPIERIIHAEGLLYPIRQSSVTSKISAPVREFRVNRGDHVKEGELIAVLENRDLAAALGESKSLYDQAQSAYRSTTAGSLPVDINKAEADERAAKEALDAARNLRESRLELLKEGALARRLVDEANVAYAQAKSQYDVAQKQLQTIQTIGKPEQTQAAKDQLDAARSRYEAAQAQMSYSEIRSPISGVVAERPLYAGEMASAGTPLMTIMDISSVIAKVNVPQSSAATLKIGMSATIETPEGKAQGKITVISPAVNPSSTTVEVWVVASNSTEKLKPGGAARVAISAGLIPDAIVVPSAALLSSHEGDLTVLVAGSDGAAHEHKVTAGIRNPDLTQILDGIKPGDQVIVAGGVGLDDGAKIRIAEDKPEAADHE